MELEDGAGDREYLEELEAALEPLLAFQPDLLVYQAGVDPLATDRLGRLSLSRDGLLERDRIVLAGARAAGVPVAICCGGGYSRLEDVVEAHANTYRTAERLFPG